MGKNTSTHTPNNDKNHLFQAVEAHGRMLVDQLREIGLDHYVELPQIAVMGDTSSGKSSLLSALSGVAFPSSSELTTRCPTQLILSKRVQFYGRMRLHRYESNTIEHEGNIDSLDEVPLAIERLTKLLVAEGHHISDDAIVIELGGPELPNLTLTDLPGLVRTVHDGEDKGMIGRIRAMVQRYMEQSRTIIIAVVPANVDFHNTEILQAAQEADPEGVRTIGVVTKLDLVDPGTEKATRELLMNQKKMLLGYHAVKCRGQRDLDDGVTIEEGKQREHAFFKSHDYWKTLPSHLWGIDKLTHRLVQILQSNIRRMLPAVMDDIRTQIHETKQELHSLGSPFDSSAERRRVFCDWVDRFVRPIQAVLKGDYESLTTNAVGDKHDVDMRLRAKIRACDESFRELIAATYDKMPGQQEDDDNENDTIQPGDYVVVRTAHDVEKSVRVQDVNDQGDVFCPAFSSHEWLGRSRYTPDRLNYLRRFIMQNRGDELPIFPPYSVFCSILREWVGTWATPTMALLSEYEDTTLRVAKRLVQDLHATPRVEEFMLNCADDIMEQLRIEAEAVLANQLVMERRPYTQDAQLMTLFTDMLKPGLQTLLTQRLSVQSGGMVPFDDLVAALTDIAPANEEHDTVVMDCGLRAYFKLAIPRYVDFVPMQLNELLLRGFVTRMKTALQGTTDEQLERLLLESDSSRERRAYLSQKLETLHKAQKQIKSL